MRGGAVDFRARWVSYYILKYTRIRRAVHFATICCGFRRGWQTPQPKALAPHFSYECAVSFRVAYKLQKFSTTPKNLVRHHFDHTRAKPEIMHKCSLPKNGLETTQKRLRNAPMVIYYCMVN
eukprot:SAG11_NODE_2696_length_3080_cov_2.220731_1_plen_121_part_10